MQTKGSVKEKNTRSPGVAKPTERIVRAFHLLADLASQTDLANVDTATKDHLLVSGWDVLGLSLLEFSGATKDPQKAWRALCDFHVELLAILRNVFGASESLDRGKIPRLIVKFAVDIPLGFGFPRTVDRVLFEYDDPPSQLVGFLQMALVTMINSDPFPMRRCLHCRRIFVSGTDVRRIYCSRTCTMGAADLRRSPAVRQARAAAMREAARWQKANPGGRAKAQAKMDKFLRDSIAEARRPDKPKRARKSPAADSTPRKR